MDRGLVVAACEECHHVACVDDLGWNIRFADITVTSLLRAYQSVVDVADPFPFAVGSHNLQAPDRLAPQNGNAADVCKIQEMRSKRGVMCTCVSL